MSNIITKIEAQKKKQNRVNVYIDEEFAFGCSSELVYYHNLSKGKEIHVGELKAIVKEDNYLTGKTLGLKYVERALKSESQVREYLIKKEYEEETINRVINFLKDYNFINDEYYTRAYVSQYIKSQGKSNIKYKLLQKGIEEELINSILMEFSKDIELEVALKLAEKRVIILSKKEKDLRKIKIKLNTFLISKGYNFDIVNSVVNEIDFASLENETKEEKIEEKTDEDLERAEEEMLYLAKNRYEKLARTETDNMKIRKKLHDFLLRKGYNYGQIKSVINKVIEGNQCDY